MAINTFDIHLVWNACNSVDRSRVNNGAHNEYVKKSRVATQPWISSIHYDLSDIHLQEDEKKTCGVWQVRRLYCEIIIIITIISAIVWQLFQCQTAPSCKRYQTKFWPHMPILRRWPIQNIAYLAPIRRNLLFFSDGRTDADGSLVTIVETPSSNSICSMQFHFA